MLDRLPDTTSRKWIDRNYQLPSSVLEPACFLRISSLDSLERHDVLLNVSGQVYANNHPEPPLSASAVRLFELQGNAVLMTMQKAHRDVRTRGVTGPELQKQLALLQKGGRSFQQLARELP